MTEQDTTADDYRPARVIDEPGTDPCDVLTVRELGIAAKRLGEDPVEAVQAPTAKRWEALATMGWLLARRRYPTAPIGAWLDLPGNTVLDYLGLIDEDGAPTLDQAATQDDGNPTDPS